MFVFLLLVLLIAVLADRTERTIPQDGAVVGRENVELFSVNGHEKE